MIILETDIGRERVENRLSVSFRKDASNAGDDFDDAYLDSGHIQKFRVTSFNIAL